MTYTQIAEVWYSVRVICESGCEDIVSTFIFESGFSGLEETYESGKTIFTAYYSSSPELQNPFEQLREAVDQLSLISGKKQARILSVEEVPQEDWELSWRRGLDAVEIGSRLVVRPSWVKYNNREQRKEIIIDPRMAFGTGNHETTRLCLEILEKTDLMDISVLDAGCGSGILSITAAKLGARCAIGFDINLDSIDNARKNVKVNSVGNRVQVYEGDLATVEPGRFDLVFANIISSVLIPCLGRFNEFLLPDGIVIFSGLLSDEENMFITALKKKRFVVSEITRMNEWIAITAQKKTS